MFIAVSNKDVNVLDIKCRCQFHGADYVCPRRGMMSKGQIVHADARASQFASAMAAGESSSPLFGTSPNRVLKLF